METQVVRWLTDQNAEFERLVFGAAEGVVGVSSNETVLVLS